MLKINVNLIKYIYVSAVSLEFHFIIIVAHLDPIFYDFFLKAQVKRYIYIKESGRNSGANRRNLLYFSSRTALGHKEFCNLWRIC